MVWVQICKMTLRVFPPVFIKYKFIGMGWGLLTLKNDPTCSLAPRVVSKYKLHRDGVGFKFLAKKSGPFDSMTH